jgi:hypothetical protein
VPPELLDLLRVHGLAVQFNGLLPLRTAASGKLTERFDDTFALANYRVRPAAFTQQHCCGAIASLFAHRPSAAFCSLRFVGLTGLTQ